MNTDSRTSPVPCNRRTALVHLLRTAAAGLLSLTPPSSNAGALRAWIAVEQHPTAAYPGQVVRIPVRLLIQDGHRSPAGLGNARLQVFAARVAASAEPASRLPNVVTDAAGRAVIPIRMPVKLSNKVGREVATKVVVDALFPGSGGTPPARPNRRIQIKVWP